VARKRLLNLGNQLTRRRKRQAVKEEASTNDIANKMIDDLRALPTDVVDEDARDVVLHEIEMQHASYVRTLKGLPIEKRGAFVERLIACDDLGRRLSDLGRGAEQTIRRLTGG